VNRLGPLEFWYGLKLAMQKLLDENVSPDLLQEHEVRHRLGLKAALRIRICIYFGRQDPDPDPHWEYGSGSRRTKITHKSEENSSFEMLDVLFQGMKTSPLA
jgi:hypothetical protein